MELKTGLILSALWAYATGHWIAGTIAVVLLYVQYYGETKAKLI